MSGLLLLIKKLRLVSTTTIIFEYMGFCGTLFLDLAAQYESWTSPIAAIMGLPIALLGTTFGLFCHGRAGQHLYTNRYHPADRPLCEERHPDCRICP